jgi:ATP-dependent DNA helicase DinG
VTEIAEPQVTAPLSFAEAQEVLAANLQGYARRTHQMALAAMIEEVLAGGGHGIAQAGTGTGKSLAALITHILAGQRLKKQGLPHRTVVATATKALQGQYALKDLPFLARYLGVPFEWAVLKGRSNYPCHLKIEELADPTPAQQRVIARVQEISTPEAVRELAVVDRESFPGITGAEWSAFGMSADECPGKKDCPFGVVCITERAKTKAADADVVITNTSYLLQDLILRKQSDDTVQLLGEIGRVVVDEAHTLAEVARGALEDTIGQGSLVKLAKDMGAYMKRENLEHSLATKVEWSAGSLWEHLEAVYRTWMREKNYGSADPMALTEHALMMDFGSYFIDLIDALSRAREEVASKRASDDRQRLAKARMMRRSANMLDRLMAYAGSPEGETVRWAELEVKTFRGQRHERVLLCSSPVDVGPFLRDLLWEKIPAVLMSATLAVGGSFEFTENNVGLRRNEATTYSAGSPFNYPEQAVLFTPDKDRPEPLQKTVVAWKNYAQGVTRQLVRASGGGALLLFTSRTAMNEAYSALAGDFHEDGLTVLKQDDTTPGELVRVMKEDGHAVLFALKTFFEGVDIPGSALRLVVLDKLPFVPPTDLVHKAREEAVARKYGTQRAGFDHLSVPEMTLTLTQAFGRLVRSTDDKGVVAILDSRLNTKGYGRKIMDTLPPARRTSDIRVAAEFLATCR